MPPSMRSLNPWPSTRDTRRIRAVGIWPIPTVTARHLPKRSNGSSRCSVNWAGATATTARCRQSPSSTFRRRNSTTACAKCRRTRRKPSKARVRSQAAASYWIPTSANPDHDSARRSAAPTRTSEKCRLCAKPEDISPCSADMTTRTRSSGTCTTSIWGMRRHAVSNATGRNRGCVASVCSNSTRTIRKPT